MFSGTYTTHAWRIRESGSGRLLGTYVGQEATVEMTPAAACLVHKGFSSGYRMSKKQYPKEWGSFQQRSLAEGIPIRVQYSSITPREGEGERRKGGRRGKNKGEVYKALTSKRMCAALVLLLKQENLPYDF